MQAIFNKMIPVHTSIGKDEIRAALYINDRTSQKTVRVMVKQVSGLMSDAFSFSASAIRGKNGDNKLWKLLDYGTEIVEDDVRIVAEFFCNDETFITLPTLTEYDDKESMVTVCARFLAESTPSDGKHVIIPTDEFNRIAKDCGYSVPLRLKKLLLEGDILAPSDSRKYDYKGIQDDAWAIRMRIDALRKEVI